MGRTENGQGLIEYALILVLMTIVVINILVVLGPVIANVFNRTVCGYGDDAPCMFADDDQYSTPFNTVVTFDVTTNDQTRASEIDYSSVELIGSGPSHGALIHAGRGVFTYTPYLGFSGVDSFHYTISNDAGATQDAEVTISVGDSVVAVDDPGSVKKNQTAIIHVVDNDFAFPAQDLTTPRITSDPENGSAVVSADKLSISYAPENNFEGIDRLEYELCNTLGDCDTARVTIDVYAAGNSPAALTQTSESGPKIGGQSGAEPGSVEYMDERIEQLWEASSEQEEALREVLLLMDEAMVEITEAPLEFTEENGELELFERMSAILVLWQDGDYESAIEQMAALGAVAVEFPEEVRLKSIAKFLPHAVDACLELNGNQVHFRTFAEARQAVLLFGALNSAAEMDELWEIIESRNEFIVEVHPALVASAEGSIEILLDSGQNKYIKLAERLEDELLACSGG